MSTFSFDEIIRAYLLVRFEGFCESDLKAVSSVSESLQLVNELQSALRLSLSQSTTSKLTYFSSFEAKGHGRILVTAPAQLRIQLTIF